MRGHSGFRYLPRWAPRSLPAASLLIAATAAAQTGAIGLSAIGARIFENEDIFGVYQPAAFDEFAHSLAAGDFNGDGADDLATGIPFDDGKTGIEVPDSGAVVVRYGATGVGLFTGTASAVLNQLGVGSPDAAGEGDLFGFALAACDFNHDGFDDLAVGIPGEEHLGHAGAGALQIHYGSPSGLHADGDLFFTQSTPGIPGDVETDDRFGFSLACGDFNGDGYSDLAAGVPSETVSSNTESGMVVIIPGSAAGLSAAGATSLDQDSSGMDGETQFFDHFGLSLAAGNFDGGIYDDLAIGVPGETIPPDDHVGAVHVVFGSPTGLGPFNILFSAQAFGDPPQAGANFGSALATGDLDGDGKDDLAIGAPNQDVNQGGLVEDAGQVHIVYGAGAIGLNFSRGQIWTQVDILGAGNNEASDHFGLSLAAADFDADGIDDLSIGHPGESSQSGAITVIMGTFTGLTAARHREIEPGNHLFPGQFHQANRRFGWAFAPGDFDGDRHADLAVGAPEARVGPFEVGQEMVLSGSLHTDGFDDGLAPMWLTSVEPGSSVAMNSTRFAGATGLEIHVDPLHRAFVSHDIPARTDRYRARFMARLWPLAITHGTYFVLLQGTISGAPMFSLYVNRDGNENGITVGVVDNDGIERFPSFLIPVPFGWRAIEVDWRAGNPAHFDLWIDGHFYPLLDEEPVPIDNSLIVIDSIRLGAVAQPNATGTFTIDEYASKRLTRLGELASFPDAQLGSLLWPSYQALFNAEVTAGCGDGTFCPRLPITRQQLAFFALRSKEGPAFSPPSCIVQPFDDVTTGNPLCPWIQEAKTRGAMHSCGGNRFCPQSPVSRQQAAVILLRTLEGGGYSPPDCTGDPFPDVDRDSEFCPFVQDVQAHGISAGCGGGNFCPLDPVTRAQLAPLLIETFDLFVPEL